MFRRLHSRRGFSLVEALVAVTLTALAGGVLLLAVETSLKASEDAYDRTVAQGLAERLIDEIFGMHYSDPDGHPHEVTLGPTAWEASVKSRERFNDTDDYHNYAAQPPLDRFGYPLGAGDGEGGTRSASVQLPADFFDRWRERVEVYYVDEADPSVRLPDGQTSNCRAVEVVVEKQNLDGGYRPLAAIRRVYAYVPPVGSE